MRSFTNCDCAVDVVPNIASVNPICLGADQATQCITQVLVDGGKTRDLTVLTGLTTIVVNLADNIVGQILTFNGHIFYVDALTDLTNESTAILSKNGSDRKDSSLDISVVLHMVAGLLQDLPADQPLIFLRTVTF